MTDTQTTAEEQAAVNLRAFLMEAFDRYTHYVSISVALGNTTRRPDLDKDAHFGFEVESKPGNRFAVLMPGLPIEVLRAGVPSYLLPSAERRAHEIRIRHEISNPDYLSADYWGEALIRCGRVADYRTPEQAIALLFERI